MSKKPIRRKPASAERSRARRTTSGRVRLAAAGPVTLAQARALAGVRTRPARGARAARAATSPAAVGLERRTRELTRDRERRARIREYADTLAVMKRRGVTGRAAMAAGRAPTFIAQPLQVFAEGDSWFEYPVPFFGGGVVPRLEDRLGVPILNLADAGDEVRFMLGVEQRRLLVGQFTNGCPAGGPWDAMLFSGGGNDIVDDPMALWIRDYDAALPPSALVHQGRLDAALALVRAGYEDLIGLRDRLSPPTHLFFHAYDFAIPDGRGICHLGPWLKPTFDLRGFPTQAAAFGVMQALLRQFAALLHALAASHADVTFINGQGTLAPKPSSWHNELHPSKSGFDAFATLFHRALKQAFPARVL